MPKTPTQRILLSGIQGFNNNMLRAKAISWLSIVAVALLLPLTAHANDDFYVQAKTAFENDQLDAAELSIEKALKSHAEEVNVLFLAGQIAGKRAQQANIFTKLGYARDAKKYFTKALEINPKHQPALIGLIRFHRQTPVMAGGDKESVFELIERLRSVDQRTAFAIEAPMLLQNNQLDLTKERFNAALNARSGKQKELFLFDAAMVFSAYGHHQYALKQLLSIDMSRQNTTSFADMRLYQLGKLAAETHSHLDLGHASMLQYSKLPEENKTIPQDWVTFRLAQIQFLKNPQSRNPKPLLMIQLSTADDELKEKIDDFLAAQTP